MTADQGSGPHRTGANHDQGMEQPNYLKDDWGYCIKYPLDLETNHRSAFPFSIERKAGRAQKGQVYLSIETPDFAVHDGAKMKELYWAGLESITRFIAMLNFDTLVIERSVPDYEDDASAVAGADDAAAKSDEAVGSNEAVDFVSDSSDRGEASRDGSFVADLRYEAMILRQARQISKLNLDFSKFANVSNLGSLAAALTNHPNLKFIGISNPDVALPALQESGEADAFANAILSLPKLRNIQPPELVGFNRLGDLIRMSQMTKLELSIFDLTASDSFFAALADPRVTLKGLDVLECYHIFDEQNGHGQLAKKLTSALDANRTLETLSFTISGNKQARDRANEATTVFQQRLAGSLLGNAMGRHPVLKDVKLHFAWHADFFMQILAGVSTNQQLRYLTLSSFEGSAEQCSFLVQALQSLQLIKLRILGLKDPNDFLSSFKSCATIKRVERLEVEGSSGSVATISALMDFFLDIEDLELYSITLKQCSIQKGEMDICPATFIDAFKRNCFLRTFYCPALMSDIVEKEETIFSPATKSVCDGILIMNKEGRRYIRTDVDDKEKGIDVLASVANNLHCLFLHLRENPYLCYPSGKELVVENTPSCTPSSTAMELETRKRKAVDEVSVETP